MPTFMTAAARCTASSTRHNSTDYSSDSTWHNSTECSALEHNQRLESCMTLSMDILYHSTFIYGNPG